MYLCIDIGGTKTLAALINDRRRVLHSVRFATPSDQDDFFQTLVSTIRANFSLEDLKVISVAIPGPVQDNQILWLGNLPWTNFDLGTKLEKLFNVPVFLENDANLAGIAEAENLPGLSVYLTFSTGIGGSVIKGGVIDPSIQHFEPGHDKYDFNGESVEWEDFASAKAILDHFGKMTEQIKKKSDWVEISCRIATGLRPIIANIHPDRIIFGGPLGLELKKYYQPLEKQLSVALPTGVTMPKLLVAKYKNESVLHGCYLYAQRQLAAR
ncbi:ROK family protein [Candidatus Saccharibacteria bacterium]|nr:ROK family protein [Candidatus Saccharibacteria bacterium]